MGFKIFIHAIGLVLSNIGVALRISGLLYVVPVVIFQIVVATVVLRSADPLSTLRVVAVIYSIVAGLAVLWIAVAWHRYVLLDEAPGAAFPVFHGDRVLAYFGNSILVGLIAFAIALVVFVPLAFVSAGIAHGGGALSPLITIVPLISIFVIAVFAYRFSLVLPASAVGKPIKLSQAWAATRGNNGAIFALAFISALCVFVLGVPSFFLSQYAVWWVAAIWDVLVGWVEVIVGVSIITTLYGHYVEKRPVS